MQPSNPPNTSGTARLMTDPPGFAVGWQQPVYVPSPPAGQGFTRKVDGRYFERLLTVTFTLTTSAVVANRFPLLSLLDTNGVTVTSVPAGGTVVAATGLNVALAQHGPGYAFGASGGTFGFLPDLVIPPGWVWALAVSGMDAGDQVSGVVLLVQQYPNDAVAIDAP